MRLLTPAEWGIVALSLKVGGSRCSRRCRSPSLSPGCSRAARFPGKVLIEAIVHLPLVVPPVVTGWLLLLAFAPAGRRCAERRASCSAGPVRRSRRG